MFSTHHVNPYYKNNNMKHNGHIDMFDTHPLHVKYISCAMPVQNKSCYPPKSHNYKPFYEHLAIDYT